MRAQPVTADPNDMWGLLLYSMRYAMGRSSYAPGEAVDLVLRYADALETHQLQQIADEIDDHLKLFGEHSARQYKQPADILRDLQTGAAKMREAARARK